MVASIILVFCEVVSAQPIPVIKIKIGYNSVRYFVKNTILPAMAGIKIVKKVAKNIHRRYLLTLLASKLDLTINQKAMPAGITAKRRKPTLITSL